MQSNTILRHIGRKFNLMGDGSAAQDSTIDLLLDQMGDFDDTFTGMCYSSYNDGGKESYVADMLPTVLTQLAEVLGDKPFMVCGEFREQRLHAPSDYHPCATFVRPDHIALPGQPTIPDFKIYELLAKCKVAFGEDCLDAAPSVAAYCARVKALPTIATYLESDRAIERPLNNAHAQFK